MFNLRLRGVAMINAFELFACDGETWYMAGSHPTEAKAMAALDDLWADKTVAAVKLVAEIVDKRTGDLKDKVLTSRSRRDGLPYFNSKKATLSRPRPAERAPRGGGLVGTVPAPIAAPKPVQRPDAAMPGRVVARNGGFLAIVALLLITNQLAGTPIPSAIAIAVGFSVAVVIVWHTFRDIRPHLLVEIDLNRQLSEGSSPAAALPKRRRKKAEKKTAVDATQEQSGPASPVTDPAEEEAVRLRVVQVAKSLLAMTVAAMEALKTFRGGHLRLDRQDRFGICLFLDGAVAGYCDGFDVPQRRLVSEEVVAAVASDANMVGWFLDNMAVHLLDERAAEIRRRGMEAGRLLLGGLPGAEGMLPGALADWSAPREAEANRAVVLFTDLVGSTQDAWTSGDEAHLERVRTHDAIVRTALTAHNGREVKHTGDGIMAAFAAETDAVAAALRIVQDFRNAKESSFGMLDIKIGIASGPAMHEGADIFGRTVQLAARLTGVAEIGGIAVSSSVAEAAARGFTFTSLGLREMKGLPEPIEVFVPDGYREAAA